jgi:hypothetical protein
MPKVGTGKSAKHFSYTKKGEAAAKREASRSGKKVAHKESKKPKK